eukprot:COSAG06_NODE_17448_length_940_cov_1.727705_2_plen_52_part_01
MRKVVTSNSARGDAPAVGICARSEVVVVVVVLELLAAGTVVGVAQGWCPTHH